MRWLLLILCCACCAQDGDSMRRSKLRVVASGGGASYLINQGFEGTGYDNAETWTETGGTPNEDYTSYVLDGSQSLYMNGASVTPNTDSPNFGDTSEFYFKFYFRPITHPGGGRRIIRFLINAGIAGSSEIQINNSGQLIIVNGTSANAATPTGMTVGNDYTVWGYFKKGTGTDGVATIAWAPKTGSETKPTSDGGGNGYSTKTNCNGTSDVDQFRLTAQLSTTAPEYVMDKLQISTTNIP